VSDESPERDPATDATVGATRALAPVAGVLLLAVTVVLAGVVGAALVGGVGSTALDPPPTTAMTCSAAAGADRLSLTHRGGDDGVADARGDELGARRGRPGPGSPPERRLAGRRLYDDGLTPSGRCPRAQSSAASGSSAFASGTVATVVMAISGL